MTKVYRPGRPRPRVAEVTIGLSAFEMRVLRKLARRWVPRGQVQARAAYELRTVLRSVLYDTPEVTGVPRSARAQKYEPDEL